ncbi:MAG: aldolase [Actinobacteria bacterium]|nr:aldolase [Actinomycetota bacterium]
MSGSLPAGGARDLVERAREIAEATRERYPGDRPVRQPLHTLYVPADRFSPTTTAEFGSEALGLLETHAPDPAAFEDAFGIEPSVSAAARERVEEKLRREPIEDVRIDFEDGYGVRPDDEEDAHAVAAAGAVASARAAGSLPASFGIRVRSFADGAQERSIRTLDVFCSTLVERAGGLPEGFVVTFPKVIAPEHVAVFADTLERLELTLGLAERALTFEVQVETPRSVIDAYGAVAAGGIVDAADGRLTAMHFGVFDYTASLGLMPWEQRLDHPANDLARRILQVALAGTGVRISDGSTNVVPATDRTEDVHAAWRLHADHVRHSLAAGFYQGWDLHPAHLVSRYAAVYGWLLPRMDESMSRVRSWREQAEAAGVLDEPATVSSLLRYLRFAVTSGAAGEDEVLAGSGLAHAELFPGGQGH